MRRWSSYTHYSDHYRELLDFTLSIAVIGTAFSIRYMILSNYALILATFTAVSIGFLAHELAHRYVARYFGGSSRYRAWYLGLLITFVLSIASRGQFVFIVPGTVEIVLPPWYSPRVEVSVVLAGPLTNIAIGSIYMILSFILSIDYLHPYLLIIGQVNAFLGFFNLLPIPPLDGYRIFRGNIFQWLSLFAFSLLLVMYYYM